MSDESPRFPPGYDPSLRDLYEQRIGEFIVVFSQLEFAIRHELYRLLQIKALAFDIVTGPYDFAMLCTVTRELLLRTFPLLDQHSVRVKKLFKTLYELNDKRVRVAHGAWTVGFTATTGARHVARSSLTATEHFGSAEELREATIAALDANAEFEALITELIPMFERMGALRPPPKI